MLSVMQFVPLRITVQEIILDMNGKNVHLGGFFAICPVLGDVFYLSVIRFLSVGHFFAR